MPLAAIQSAMAGVESQHAVSTSSPPRCTISSGNSGAACALLSPLVLPPEEDGAPTASSKISPIRSKVAFDATFKGSAQQKRRR